MLMKNYLLVFFLIPFFAFSQNNLRKNPPKKEPSAASKFSGNFIDVNAAGYPQSNYTIEQLVKNVLISSGSSVCGTPNVSNVTVSPNLAVTNQNRAWGYFNKGTTNFPFTDGIVLSTGFAKNAGNSFIAGTQSDDNTGGSDPDLVAVMNQSGTYTNAAILEFDFVPTSTQIKFNYILASEEYTSPYPCSYADGFVLLLKPVGGTTYTNMAVLPGGAGPVSVTNIHPAAASTGGNLNCGAVNAQYFDSYNTTNVQTNFMGRTIPLEATATVVAGQAYHFKMVVADYGTFGPDTGFDTAIFLQGGSFDIGVKLLDDTGATLPSDINVCDNAPTTISSSLNLPNATYKWFKDGTLINGANGTSYVVTSPGTYKIEVSVPGNNCPGTAQVVVHGGVTPYAQDATYLLCATSANPNFNLQQLQPMLSTTPGAQFKFYKTLASAQAQDNTNITNITNYASTGEVLYVVVSSATSTFCHKIVKLTLEYEQTPVVTLTSTKLKICQGESITLTAAGATTYQWNNTSSNGATQTLTPQQTTTYEVFGLGPKGCKSQTSTKITIEVLPTLKTNITGVQFCAGDSAILNSGITGTGLSYLWNTGQTTSSITVNQWGEYTLAVNNGVCVQNFTYRVEPATLPIIKSLDYDNGKLIVHADNPSTVNPLEYTLDGTNWQESNIFTGIQNNKFIVIRVRIKNTHCEVPIDFFTTNITNVITPNGDGYNDVMDLSPMVNFPGFKGAVYDRYGKLIHEFTPKTPIWDGLFQGKRVPTDNYWYLVNWELGINKIPTKHTGWILLKNKN